MNNEVIIKNEDLFLQQEPDLFYVYTHYKLSNDVPFYVGKGNGQRCFGKHDRGYWWINTVRKHEYYIIIDAINLEENAAYILEIKRIADIGRKDLKLGTLVNLTDGGEGVRNRIFTTEERQRKSELYKANPEMWQYGENREKYFGKQLYGENNPNFGNTGELNTSSKAVVHLSKTGVLITSYASAIEAAAAFGLSSSGIGGVCAKKRKQIKGLHFMFKDDFEHNGFSLKRSKKEFRRAVQQLDLVTHEILQTYESCKVTSLFGFCSSKVNAVANGKRKSSGGFFWRFVDEN